MIDTNTRYSLDCQIILYSEEKSPGCPLGKILVAVANNPDLSQSSMSCCRLVAS